MPVSLNEPLGALQVCFFINLCATYVFPCVLLCMCMCTPVFLCICVCL